MASAAVADTLRGLKCQVRIVGALLMRELKTRFGRENVGYLWLFLEPAMLATGVSTVHSFMQLHLPPGMRVAPFYISGYTSFVVFRSVTNRSASTVSSNSTLLHHRNITIPDLLIARCLLDVAASLTCCMFLLLVVQFFGWGELPKAPLVFITGWSLLAWFCFGLGAVILAVAIRYPTIDRFVHPAGYLMLPVSGAFSCFEELSPIYRYVVSWVPLAHTIEMVREGTFGFTSHYTNVPYVVAWSAGLTLVGLAGLRSARKHVNLAL